MPTEYYWVLQDRLNNMLMFWRFDKYFTLLVDDGVELTEDQVVDMIKEIVPNVVTHANHSIRQFDPENNLFPDFRKMLVVLEVSDGLTKVGPYWVSSESPEQYLKGVVPNGCYKVGGSKDNPYETESQSPSNTTKS
jgi:hypothetical protein